MDMTRENDGHPPVNGVPWMQKARPGLRSALAGRVVPLAASPTSTQYQSSEPIKVEIAIPTDVRKQRLLREAHETEGGDIASAGNDFLPIIIAVLMLGIYWGAAAVAVGSAMSRPGDGVQPNFATQKNERPASDALPRASTRNRAASVTNYSDSGTR